MSLIIYSTTPNDEGTYTCVPKNRIGTKNTGSTRLEIKNLPYFIEKPRKKYEVFQGASFSAPCSGSGEVSLTVSWRPEVRFYVFLFLLHIK